MTRWKLMSVLGAALLLTAAVACAPAPPEGVQLTCSGLQATAAVSPGVSSTPKAQTFTLASTSKVVGCADTLGLGITGGKLLGTSLSFPSLDCTGTGATGVGSGTIKWSDLSTSAFTASITLTSPLGAQLRLQIASGRFAGTSGTIDISATPTAGDCATQITAESFSGGPLTLR